MLVICYIYNSNTRLFYGGYSLILHIFIGGQATFVSAHLRRVGMAANRPGHPALLAPAWRHKALFDRVPGGRGHEGGVIAAVQNQSKQPNQESFA
jgi:hypothetical protein